MIEITDFDHNGKGIGRLNDKIAFVKGAIPGEIVDIKILKEKKKFIEASINKFIKKSPNRIESPCKYYDKCGGCDLLHINYIDQLKFKENKIKNIITKYLNNNIKINKIVFDDCNFYYRNKITFQVNNGTLGLFEEESNTIIKIDKCLLCNEKINSIIPHLNKLNLKNINKIVCRVSNTIMITIEAYNDSIDIEPIKVFCDSIYLKINGVYKLVYGNPYIINNIGKFKFLISPDSFFQVNNKVCEKLYDKIKNYINQDSVLDLYCGTGTIGIYVSNNCKKVIGIEINKYAIEDANKNKNLNNVNNIEFICGDSGKCINNIKFKPDIIIVDPPRSGLNLETITNILNINSKRIIYVSCDPMTLVRDLKILNEKYDIIEITPFDMFPNTKHVECICLLDKK